MRKLFALLLLFLGPPALAQVPVQPPLPYFGAGFDPSNPVYNFNTLIQQLNNFLTPTFPNNPGAVNFLQVSSGASGSPVTLGINPASSPNASIALSPNGNGNIVLFTPVGDTLSTGNVQIGNQASFVPTTGVAACPAVPAGRPAALSMTDHVTGYFIIQDWLNRQHGVVAC